MRVTVAGLEGVLRRGLTEALLERGHLVAVERTATAGLLVRLASDCPDVVVVPQELGDGDLPRRLCARFPSMTVLAVSPQHPTIRVFPSHHGGESYETELGLDELLATSS